MADESPVQTLTIKQEYAINYLFKRAEELDYEVFAEISQQPIGSPRTVTLHYLPTDKIVRRPTFNLEWGRTLISFQPDVAARTR